MKRIVLFALSAVLVCAVGLGCTKKAGEVDPTFRQKTEGKEKLAQADVLFDAGDYAGAQSAYQLVMEQHPGTEAANRAQFRVAQCLAKEDKTDEALAEFRKYVNANRNDSDLTVAQEYIIAITENRLQDQIRQFETAVSSLEEQNLRMNLLNQSLRKSVDAEVIYLELDYANDRLFVKLGTQTLYQYPIVSGKGKTRLKGTGEIKNFSSPRGVRRILNIEKDPLWYRPDWYWIEKGLPLPENLTMKDRGVPNHLGPYKLSIGDGIYLHGTRAGKIKPGKFSHGCIRLNNADLIQLVHLVEIGTMVYLY